MGRRLVKGVMSSCRDKLNITLADALMYPIAVGFCTHYGRIMYPLRVEIRPVGCMRSGVAVLNKY